MLSVSQKAQLIPESSASRSAVEEFVEKVFFVYAYELRGLCIALNLPFDLSRIAIDDASARRDMRGGFTLRLGPDKWLPRV
jgi:hypothetical protein